MRAPEPGDRSLVGPPVALVDTDRMMQVLNNLVKNAIHYTSEGGRVLVSTGKKEAEGRGMGDGDGGGHRHRHPRGGPAPHL